jgi:hypothetical protein
MIGTIGGRGARDNRVRRAIVGAYAAAVLLASSTPATGQPAASQSRQLQVVTSEELRLWSLGQASLNLRVGTRHRLVGRIRSIDRAPSGSPLLIFTGVEALLGSSFNQEILEQLRPNMYVAADCRISARGEAMLQPVSDCNNLEVVPAVSADEYNSAYDQNQFSADRQFNQKLVVVYGKVRLVDRLVGGPHIGDSYVSFETENGFSDVVAIVSDDARGMIATFASVDEPAVMLCRGGRRWNLVGSVGLNECRFLQNY